MMLKILISWIIKFDLQLCCHPKQDSVLCNIRKKSWKLSHPYQLTDYINWAHVIIKPKSYFFSLFVKQLQANKLAKSVFLKCLTLIPDNVYLRQFYELTALSSFSKNAPIRCSYSDNWPITLDFLWKAKNAVNEKTQAVILQKILTTMYSLF